jgi:hypothetical protein
LRRSGRKIPLCTVITGEEAVTLRLKREVNDFALIKFPMLARRGLTFSKGMKLSTAANLLAWGTHSIHAYPDNASVFVRFFLKFAAFL